MAQSRNNSQNDMKARLADMLAAMGGLQEEPDPEEKALRDEVKRQKAERAARSTVKAVESARDKNENELRRRVLKERTDKAVESKKVSRSKAAGLKSVFTLNEDELLMTGFGKGNDAVCEKLVSGDQIRDLSETPAFTAKKEPLHFQISGRVIKNAISDDPLASRKKPGQDLIGCREQIERMFFGTNFDDNIHIQMAYNILDIDKILAIHINNIVYELNNMLRGDDEEYDDVIGTIGLEQTEASFMKESKNASQQRKQQNIKKLLRSPQTCYFGDILYDTELVKKYRDMKQERIAVEKKLSSNDKPDNVFKLNKNLEERKRLESEAARRLDLKRTEAYNYLTLLGMTRQALAHGDEQKRTGIYMLEEEYDKLFVGQGIGKQRLAARESLDNLYASRVQKLNGEFLEHAKVDLSILFSLNDAVLPDEKKELLREYYNFVVRKDYKNLGFSVKHLRELMLLEKGAERITGKEYDSMRGRLYRFIDFLICRYYLGHEEQAALLVAGLRSAIEEEQKESLYRTEATAVWAALRDQITDDLLPWMVGTELAAASMAEADPILNLDVLGEVAIPYKVSAFSELIYLLTRFLDGKEINDLLTTLINKFENIAGFEDIMKAQKMKVGLAQSYRLFNRSRKIAGELRAINSFARMGAPEQDAKKTLYIEAAEVLGYSGDSESLEKYIDHLLQQSGEFTGKGNGFRNFIANNVIESDRFRYLVRYGNVKTIRRLADNKNVVAFVLKSIPDTQIVRYYNSCTGENDKVCREEMRDTLCDMITQISFRQFSGVEVRAESNTPAFFDKERKKAVIRLYLTVLYLAVKNLVYINSRYFLAFHCVERDSFLSDPVKYTPESIKYNLARFARDRVASGVWNSRVTKYLKANIENSDTWSVTTFRNQVEHLDAVRLAHLYAGEAGEIRSWFELYHYIMQRSLADRYDTEMNEYAKKGKIPDFMPTEKTKAVEYFRLVRRYRSYCKDYVKALNVAFAYNLPRYKNLSIDALFDKNIVSKDRGRAIEIKPDDLAE